MGEMKQFPNKPKIAICGLGMVGGALARWFAKVIIYDPPRGLGSVEELNTADIIFLSVPTPYKDGYDISILESVLQIIEGEKIIVLKSTVLPGTTQGFQDKYSQHRFLFNPEFLTEASADQDLAYPDRQIIGFTEQSFTIAADILALLPLAPFERIIPTREAEMIKLFNNCWFATKVIFANQMYDLCQSTVIDYDTVKVGASADKRMTGTSHLEIFHKGSRGYGGKCIPKDARALISWADQNGVDMSLLKTAEEFNATLKPNK